MRELDNEKQADFRLRLKTWLRRANRDYLWLSEQLNVAQNTVRNWMSSKPIPLSVQQIITMEYLDKDELTSSERWVKGAASPAPAKVADENSIQLEIPLSAKHREALSREAEEQGVSLERLICRIVEDAAVGIFQKQK